MVTKEELTLKEKVEEHMGRLVLFNINHVSHLLARMGNRGLAQAGVTLQVEQMPVLFAAYFATESSLSQQDIANLLQKDKSGIQRSIRTLERDGYLRVTPDHLDRRKNIIQLTPAGKLVIEKVMAMAKKMDKKVTDRLTDDEVTSLLQILRKISNILEE